MLDPIGRYFFTWELLYLIYPLGIERNIPLDLLNGGKRILV